MGNILDIREGWEVGVANELYEAGITEDGFPYTAESYHVIITDKRGRRFAHNHIFVGCNAGICTDDDNYGVPYFQDIRVEAKEKVDNLVAQIVDAGKVDLDYWTEVEPAYGSIHYQEQEAAGMYAGDNR